MSIRVRQQVRAGKGAHVNVGKSGPTSVSIKLLPGLTLNLGKDGVMVTASKRGTGVAYQKRISLRNLFS